jgi:flagellar hook-associated protein 3 FlgL
VVEVTGTGLRITSDSADVLNITVGEVSDGVTAKELGIFTDSASVQTTINGADLNPKLINTTRLENVLGTKAQGRIISAGANNDIVLTGAVNGAQLNGIEVVFQAGGTAGSENVDFDGTVLTIDVEVGVSTAEQVAAAITAEGTFNAAVDFRDALTTNVVGTGAVQAANFGVVTDNGGSGTSLDQAAGLIVSNGSSTETLDISQAVTVQDLLNVFNGAGLSLQAEINQSGTGINVRSRLSGADITIAENGGTTAEQLGIRTYAGSTNLADFNRGVGVVTESQRSFEIELDDGLGTITTHTIQLGSLNGNGELVIEVSTVDELIAEIATATGGDVTAAIASVGNGLVLTDNTFAPGASMTVRGEVAQRLGFFDGSVDPPEITTTTDTLATDDRHTQEVDSVFNTLIRLRGALESGDVNAISEAIDRLDVDLDRVNFARSEMGSRQQSLDVLSVRLEDDEVQLRTALSKDLDVDLVEAISNLTARQFALEASLRTSASILSVSILDYI